MGRGRGLDGKFPCWIRCGGVGKVRREKAHTIAHRKSIEHRGKHRSEKSIGGRKERRQEEKRRAEH